jgi:glycosyltransferase involved in cell wall biosynthesis
MAEFLVAGRDIADVSPQEARQCKYELTMSAEPDELRPRTLAGATILQIVPALRDDSAGRTTVNVAYALLQAGARALVAADGGPLVEELQSFGGEYLALPDAAANPLKIRRNAGVLEEIIGRERVDVVHARSAGAAWSALIATVRLPAWLVTNVPDTDASPRGLRSLHLRAMAQGDRVIASSADSGAQFAKRYGIPRDRLVIIPSAIDTATFDPATVSPERTAALRHAWGVRSGERVVLVPGPIAPWNGQMVLTDAVRLLAQTGLHDAVFVLIGDTKDPHAREVAARCIAHGIDGLVVQIGQCNDMPAAFAAADLVVAPAVEAPMFGRRVAQAQAMGRPVIASAVGVLQENVVVPPRVSEELRTGWLTRPGDPQDLARAIGVALALEDTVYQGTCARARQFAEFMFSPRSIAVAHRGVYTSLLARDT